MDDKTKDPMPSWPAKTTITYGDAETRGKLRHWKRRLGEHYDAFERVFRKPDRVQIVADMVRGSTSTRRKAFDKLHAGWGKAAFLEGVTLERNKALAIWSYLKPRNSVFVKAGDTVTDAERASLTQDCVCVNYIVAGTHRCELADGLWTLEVPDHALGRAVERSQFLTPEAIIREAHVNLLALPMERMNDIHYIKAGPGCFAGALMVAKEVTYTISTHVRVNTWLASEMMGDDQKPIVEVGEPGKRLGDTVLLPRPLWPDRRKA
jgi:hypothetical protein